MKKLVGKGKPFHSAIDKAAGMMKRKAGTGAEFMKELMGLPGIKQTEIQERGLHNLMDAPRMTHEQFMAELGKKPAPVLREKILGGDRSEPDSEAPYHERDYTLPGGENYREMLIKAPQEKGYTAPNGAFFSKQDLADPVAHKTAKRIGLSPAYRPIGEQFSGVEHHFGGEPGILASMRLKDRTVPGDMGYTLVNKRSGNKSQHYATAEEAQTAMQNMPESLRPMLSVQQSRGPDKKMLHLEELQSDWHQQGRDKGYIDPNKKPYTIEADQNGVYRIKDQNGQTFHPYVDGEQMSGFMTAEGAENAMKGNMGRMPKPTGVPNAPFKKNWEEMALKRLVHHAAEKGYHGIVVTPGEEQADRYSLAKHADQLEYFPENNSFVALKNGKVIHNETVEPSKLNEYIGKEAAEKLLQSPIEKGKNKLSGVDLEWGGEGMKGFYDKKVPNILNSIGKKYGVKTHLHGHKLSNAPKNSMDVAHYPRGQEYIGGQITWPEMVQANPELANKFQTQLHHFPITEEMRKDVLTNGLPLYSQGGKVHMADGGDMDQMQLEMMNKQLGMYKAADRAKAGRMAAEAIKKEPEMKASEALGQLREKGFKRTTTTQSDRTRVGGGNIGGAAFPVISNVDPEYKGKPWGVMDTGTASRLINLTNPETAWTTMLGSEHQLKSNPIVFDKLSRQFQTAMKKGLLPPELEAKINHNLALTFGEGASIRDPKIWQMADTFEKRRALAELMMGQGIPPKKGGVALGGEKSGRGVIFQPTKTLIQETEPSLFHPEHGGDIPTFAAGPRLFQLEKEASYRPDLHPGFPTLIHGKDLNMRMKPVPTESYLPDWHKAFKKANPHRKKPGYYDLALGMEGQGLPSQELTDAYLRHLIMEGFKRGGAVRMADGGQVDAQSIGVEEAPNMDVKVYFPPRPAQGSMLPVGGIQQAQQAPMQPPPPAPNQQPPQQPSPAPIQAGQPPSNILQMTRQGQAMNAMTPPQMARGGHINRDAMMLALMNRNKKVKYG